MATTGLERGREAFAAQAWSEAASLLADADRHHPLEAADLERVATAAYLTGRDEDRDAFLERAHRRYLDAGAVADAIRCAFWLGMMLLQRGEAARASGWFARGRRLVEQAPDCPERGYLLLPQAVESLDTQPARAHDTFEEVAAIADGSADRDLLALSRLGRGQARVRLGDVAAGMALLDEVMLNVEAGEVSPVPAGIIYCAVIAICQATFDLRRAQEWTAALHDWCTSQPDLVPYRGQCSVHRAELFQLHGAWDDALEEANRALHRFDVTPGHPAVGGAHYRAAEVHRLRGEFERAEQQYLLASRWGHQPQPGLALLRLAQGEVGAASGALKRALEEVRVPAVRASLLAAAVEVALAAGDADWARAATDELAAIADGHAAPLLTAMAGRAAGAVLLASGDPRAALVALRRAGDTWRGLGAPHEAARVQVLVSEACRQLGDGDGAELELDAARAVFERLGAQPELDRVASLRSGGRPPAGGLTGRELEVLRLVARGRSNRAIADELVISEHTVARHVQNIFAKLDVGSRTAAAAFAFEHDLV
jgi:ATP/maltotriose-dependent transcriptional regulator MalT